MLHRTGLSHLQLSREASSLSGGELQRARLAAQLSTPLEGITFVLDEPTSGLHPADKADVLDMLKALRDKGNSVLLVEHDPEIVAACDWILDVGPGASRDGGTLLVSAPPAEAARVRRGRVGSQRVGDVLVAQASVVEAHDPGRPIRRRCQKLNGTWGHPPPARDTTMKSAASIAAHAIKNLRGCMKVQSRNSALRAKVARCYSGRRLARRDFGPGSCGTTTWHLPSPSNVHSAQTVSVRPSEV